MKSREFGITIRPKYVKGPRPLKSGRNKALHFLGIDTETCHGNVYHSGLYDGGTKEFVDQATMTKAEASDPAFHLRFLLTEIARRCKSKKATHVVGAFYAPFDLAVLLAPVLGFPSTEKVPEWSAFSFREEKMTLEVSWRNPCFAKLKLYPRIVGRGKKRRIDYKHTIMIVDAWAFFSMSLDKALETVGAPIRKLPKPPGLGSKILPERVIRPYLQRDCEGVVYLLEWIGQWCKEYDVRFPISAPQLAGRIFRRKYLKRPFKTLYSPTLYASMVSYHGGKNQVSVKPGLYEDCTELDISSAYPEAMKQLPNFSYGDIAPVRRYAGPHGIYFVSGTNKGCKYKNLFTDDFKETKAGRVRDVAVTGYELEAIHDHHELEQTKCWGYVWRSRAKTANPLAAFVDDFYQRKENSKTPGERFFNKLMQNSLYGKFIQRAYERDGRHRLAGSMFYPFAASLITGFVRAKIHRLEHQYDSLHTATDSIKTLQTVDPATLPPGLGGLKLEVTGPCLILRNKLYAHYDREGNLKKYGLHGFQGNVKQLLKLYETGRRTYRTKRLLKWKEAHHLGLTPGLQVAETRVLRI